MTNLDLRTLGLTPDEVEAQRQQFGRNLITPQKRRSVLSLYLEKFRDPIIRILLAAAALSLIIGIIENQYVETIGIVVAILLATGIGFYFEYDAQKKFDVLNALGQEELTTVVREGRVIQIPRSELVVGDIVILEQGAEVPADGQLLEAIGMMVNESSLTGEPICHKTAEAPAQMNDSTYPRNKVLRSSMIASGHGIMKVEAIGDATEIGRVAHQATASNHIQTPLGLQLDRLSSLINKVAIIVSLAVFIAFSIHGLLVYLGDISATGEGGWLRGAEILLKYFMVAVTLVVMAVPEGLPMAVTLSLALNMRRMLKTNNLVRKLHACETMGAITVICTDKTGTLTQNQMKVSDLKYQKEEEKFLFENIAANSTAHLEGGEEKGCIGNPTECALLLYLQDKGQDYAELRRKAHIIEQLPFSTERKYMSTIVESGITGRRILYVKGAPEQLIALCTGNNGGNQEFIDQLATYEASAMRTLAFAYKFLEESDGTDCIQITEQGGLRLTGICGIMDPIRPEVPAAIVTCQNAGINVKIVTGDHEGTAIETARRIGLWTEQDSSENAISGKAFAKMSNEEALEKVEQIKVMSRARPMDKQRFVELLQNKGAVVAVTGDGTNDAPALHHAQVGLSMGSGTAIAKEASDITLIDDSFRSIATAVMWGRSLYKNIQRFIVFQLTVSLTAMVITLLGAFFDTDMPLTVTQILWINLIMDTFASLALSTIPPSSDVMKERPRRTADFIITKPMWKSIIITSALFVMILLYIILYYEQWGRNTLNVHDLTIIFTTFVMLQIWNLLNVRTIGTHDSAFHHLNQCRGLLLVIALIFIGQILIVQFGGAIFRTVPLQFNTWLIIIASTSVLFWIDELCRWLRRLSQKKQ